MSDPLVMSLQDLYQLGMKMRLPDVRRPTGCVIELGPGKVPVPGALGLEFPGWDADTMPIPCPDESVDGIYAFHFLEHCAHPIKVMREIQRVLRPGGVATIGVPYYRCAMAHQDLDHKAWYTEDTWRTLMANPYYTKTGEGWRLRVELNVVMFTVERNQMLFTQMVKE